MKANKCKKFFWIIIISSGLILFLITSFNTEVVAKETDEYINDLNADDWMVRRDAAKKLGENKVKAAVSNLISILDDKRWEVRSAAVRSLGQIGDEEVATEILKKAKDPHENVRSSALTAIENIGVDAFVSEELLDKMEELLEGNEIEIQNKAAKILGLMGSEARSVLPHLIEFMKESKSIGVSREISKISSDNIVDDIKKIVISEEIEMDRRLVATKSLSSLVSIKHLLPLKIEIRQIIKTLIYILNGEEKYLQILAIRQLGEFGSRAYMAFPDLQKKAKSDHKIIKKEAIKSIQKIQLAKIKSNNKEKFKYDMGVGTKKEGYLQVDEKTDYNFERGFGWESIDNIISEERGGSDKLKKDFCYKKETISFKQDLLNGEYKVKIITGDYENRQERMDIFAEKKYQGIVSTAKAGEFIEKEFKVDVLDNQLNIEVKGENIRINGIEIIRDKIFVDSLEELADYASHDNNYIKMKPGVYQLDQHKYVNDLDSFFEFTGNENIYDLSNVRIEFDTDLRDKHNPPIHTPEFVMSGNNNTLKGLTIENTGNGTSSGGNVLSILGNDNRVENVTLHVQGSFPYGYGDLLGKGGNPLVSLQKHSGMRIAGDNNRILNGEIYMRSFGHGFYIQDGASNTYFENCYVEGQMRATDKMLLEESGPAYEVDFSSVWRNREGTNKILPGYMKSLSEDGFRTYGGTGKITFINCKAKNMRAGWELRTGNAYLENCESTGNERGFWIGENSTVVKSRGDARYGP
ncbi:MAG: HEAT repeat domain-containing protein, partial [bacterium]